jgi:cytochrome c
VKATKIRALAVLAVCALGAGEAFSQGNSAKGQRVFGTCAACHSLQADHNMTGPSLADLWHRKAGSAASFSRYSSALKSADIVWNDKTLDDWIADPPACCARK